MERYRVAAICAASVLTVGLAMMCHEAAHVLVGGMAGGSPTVLTATEVRGNFDALSPAGFVAFGASGTLVNVLFCALGWWVLRRRSASAQLRLVAWFFFAVNGMLVATKVMGETISGFGDAMTVLRPLPATTALRIAGAVLGAVAVVFMVRRSAAALAAIVPAGEPAQRKREARRIVLIGALAATVLVVGASVANPVGTTRGMLLALGAGLGPFMAILIGVRLVPRTPPLHTGSLPGPGWPWLVAATLTAAVMWFVVGPGITLSRFMT